MPEQRKAKTMQLSGNDYAKVAERLRLFRADWPKSKTETDHFYQEDGSVEFKAWLWKDKNEYMDLVRSGIADKDVLRSTADSDGDAKGAVGVKQKDFEKLQTIAMGRALGNLGYLASGEIASFEEMEEFNKFRESQMTDQIQDAVDMIDKVKTNDELNEVIKKISHVLKYQPVIDAGKNKREELAKKVKKEEPAKPVRPTGGKRVEEPQDADNKS